MSTFSRFFVFAAALFAAVSCGRTARIDAVVSDAASSEIVVKLLDVNKFAVIDTVKTEKDGRLTCKLDIQKGQPEFVYLFHGDRKIASLILQSGDRVTVEADTLGNYTVGGSEESQRLAQVERDYAAVLARMNEMAGSIETEKDAGRVAAMRQALGQEYVAYYRDRIKYIMENSRSLTVVPVLYQTLGDNLPVMGQATDAIHFRNAADSLALSYPDSRYVKVLRKEADRRMGYLELETRIRTAEPIGYPDMELPDIRGEKRKLSDVDSKVVMVHFWTASDTGQKMFNLDVLKPVYEEFHDKGFEIYHVAIDVDKGLWAQVVKEQKHPWISVCDSRGSASPYAATYNIQALPATYIICNGELVDGEVIDAASLRSLLRRLLK